TAHRGGERKPSRRARDGAARRDRDDGTRRDVPSQQGDEPRRAHRPAVEHLPRHRPLEVRPGDENLAPPRAHLARGRDVPPRRFGLGQRNGSQRLGAARPATAAPARERRPPAPRRDDAAFSGRIARNKLSAFSAQLSAKTLEAAPPYVESSSFVKGLELTAES